MSEEKISLLPEEIAIDTVKTNLNTAESETARAILYVAPGGYVKGHSHSIESKNKYSEVYIIIKPNADRTDYTVEVHNVAGSNSPTGTLEHSIEQSDVPQICIAIKKGQEDGLWTDWVEQHTNPKAYLKKLDLEISLENGLIYIVSHPDKNQESEKVIINFNRDSITYCSSQNEFKTLSDLKKKDLSPSEYCSPTK